MQGPDPESNRNSIHPVATEEEKLEEIEYSSISIEDDGSEFIMHSHEL